MPKTSGEAAAPGDIFAASVIATYLVGHVVALTYFALIAWLANNVSHLHSSLPLIPDFSTGTVDGTDEKFDVLRTIILASCFAGLGGAVFMIRELYLSFCYGKIRNGETEFLKRYEIPRYILLPFSSVILGPIGVCLAQAGTIVFAGFTSDSEAPYFTIVALSFILGFSYHDTLNYLRQLSKRILREPQSQQAESNRAEQDEEADAGNA